LISNAPFNRVQIIFARLRQRAKQFHQVTASEGFGAHWDDLADRLAASFHDEGFVAISHAIQDF
jgi:hypothetical protein